jgi:Ribosomal protein L7Ae/L30e/S12e/Gadd45 family
MANVPWRVITAKLVIISGNCPPLRKSELEYYAMLSKTHVHHYAGNNINLGTACGKYCLASKAKRPTRGRFEPKARNLEEILSKANRVRFEPKARNLEEIQRESTDSQKEARKSQLLETQPKRPTSKNKSNSRQVLPRWMSLHH